MNKVYAMFSIVLLFFFADIKTCQAKILLARDRVNAAYKLRIRSWSHLKREKKST